MSETVRSETVRVEADIPRPLFEGLHLVSQTFNIPMNELLTDAVRGTLQAMEGDALTAATNEIRFRLKAEIRKLLEAEA